MRIFQRHFKCVDILHRWERLARCDTRKTLVPITGKPETNLTYLTYLIGRLDLIRFNLMVHRQGLEP